MLTLDITPNKLSATPRSYSTERLVYCLNNYETYFKAADVILAAGEFAYAEFENCVVFSFSINGCIAHSKNLIESFTRVALKAGWDKVDVIPKGSNIASWMIFQLTKEIK